MNVVHKVKEGASAIVAFVKKHPIAAVVLVVGVGSLVIVPVVALVNKLKNMVPGAARHVPDLKVRGASITPAAPVKR